jgi:hypothetical protein
VSEAAKFVAMRQGFEKLAKSEAPLDVCESEGEKYIIVVKGMRYMDDQSREFVAAMVYTRLRMLARGRGNVEKQAEFEKKALDALRRGGAAHATVSTVDILEKKL